MAAAVFIPTRSFHQGRKKCILCRHLKGRGEGEPGYGPAVGTASLSYGEGLVNEADTGSGGNQIIAESFVTLNEYADEW